MTKEDLQYVAYKDQLWFAEDTDPLIMSAVYRCWQRGWRVRIWYGDPETGHAWLEENGVLGRIEPSVGPQQIPILLYSKRSLGGGAILCKHIVRIVETKTKVEIYRHSTFGRGHFRVGGELDIMSPRTSRRMTPVYHYHSPEDDSWKNVANFDTWDRAVRWVEFMTGKRMSK